MKPMKHIKGVIPAMLTCFDDEGKFSPDRQKRLTEYLIGKGVGGLYLTGSTGETFLMTPDEKKRVVDVVVEQNAGRVPLIVHVGAIGTDMTIDLACHAEKAGADAVSSVPPFYYKFSQDEIFGYYSDVCSSCSLPMVIYNIALAGLVDFDTIKRLSTIDAVSGIKYTAATQYVLTQIKEEISPDFMVYSGFDEMAMGGVCCGADGCIGSFYNIIPEVFMNIYSAYAESDIGKMQYWQKIGVATVMLALRYPMIGAVKRILHWNGIETGFCRKPFLPLTEGQENELRDGLKAIKAKYDVKNVEMFDNL